MRSTGPQPPLLQSGSGGSRGHQSCRGEGGTTAGEFLKPIMWPIIRSTPDVRPGTAPDEKTEMRYPTRASEPVHRRLWVLPSPLHDPSVQELHDESSWRWETVRCVLDWGHQNGMVRPCSRPASQRSWQGAPKTRSTPCLRHPIPQSRGDRRRYRQELVPCCRPRRARGAIVLRQKIVAWPSGSAARQYTALPDRHGNLRRRTSHRPQTRIAGSRCQVDAGQIYPAL